MTGIDLPVNTKALVSSAVKPDIRSAITGLSATGDSGSDPRKGVASRLPGHPQDWAFWPHLLAPLANITAHLWASVCHNSHSRAPSRITCATFLPFTDLPKWNLEGRPETSTGGTAGTFPGATAPSEDLHATNARHAALGTFTVLLNPECSLFGVTRLEPLQSTAHERRHAVRFHLHIQRSTNSVESAPRASSWAEEGAEGRGWTPANA